MNEKTNSNKLQTTLTFRGHNYITCFRVLFCRKLKAQIHISNREEEAIADQKGSTVQKEISCEQAQENSVSEQKKVV